MEFNEVVVKENLGLCRCCLSEGCYKDVCTEYTWMNETEIYAEMLMDCFDISIMQHSDGPNGASRLICEVCITRLRDACNFKKQVQETEKKFIDMISKGEFQPKALQEMKSEVEVEVEPETENTVNAEYLEDEMDFSEAVKEDSDSDYEQPGVSRAATPPKKKRLKKIKIEPPKKGGKRTEAVEAVSKSSISSTKRNRLIKRNALTVLENSSAMPFKWHRQNYLCFFCHKDFKDIQLLKDHTSNDHGKSNIKAAVSYLRRDEKVKVDLSDAACLICDEKYVDLTSLIDHLKTAHDKQFTEGYGYGLIPYLLISAEVFQCSICGETFQFFIKLNQHMNEHFGSYVCELCGKSFLSQDRLRCHTLTHGSGFKCSLCSETFDSLTQKNKHESQTHQQDKLIKCFYCADTFQNYNQRKKHHHLAHNIEVPEHNCPSCGKSFQILSKMKVHLKEVHIREKNFSCSICGQKFFSKTHVQKHMVKHSGERVHQCSVCNKSYARRQTLRDHMRIHNNDKRFACTFCSQSFVQNNSLRLHLKVHHPETME